MDDVLVFPAATRKFPTSRSQGRTRRGELEDQLLAQQPHTLIIDFKNVDAMTISYVDEFLGKFLAAYAGHDGELVLAIQNLNDENTEAVHIALDRRDLNVVLVQPNGQLVLLGDQRAKPTFEAATSLRSFRAGALATALGISAQNANNRLKPLVETGALRKVRVTGAPRGGKEFEYSTINGSPNGSLTSAAGLRCV